MKTTPDTVEEYSLLFTSLEEAKGTLQGATSTQLYESAHPAQEIEALRIITEEVNAEAMRVQSLTLS